MVTGQSLVIVRWFTLFVPGMLFHRCERIEMLNKCFFKHLALIMVTLPIAAGSSDSNAQSATNLLINDTFEAMSLSPWSVNAWGGQMAAQIVTPGREGAGQSVSLLVSGDPVTVIFRQNVTLKGGTSYRASVWIKASQNTSATLRVRKTTPYYNIWGQQTLQIGTEWRQFAFDVASIEDNLARFEISLNEAGVKIYVDDAALKELSGADGSQYSCNPARVVPADFFGMHINKGHVVDLWSTVTTVGPGMIRLWDTGTDWAGIEKSKNQFDWIRMDMYVDRIKRALPRSTIMYTFGRVPGWANGQKASSAPPLNLADWESFVRSIVNRHGAKIDYYETWNEFDYSGFWSGTAGQMLEMQKILKNVVSQLDPTAKILLPNITVNGLGILEQYLAVGGANYADAASFHMYVPGLTIEERFAFTRTIRDMLGRHGFPNMPIFNTEGAVGIEFESPPTLVQQRSQVARYYLVSWLAGVENSSWYFWENDPSMGRMSFVDDVGTYASPTAAALAYKTIREWIVGAKCTQLITERTSGLYQIEINKDGVDGTIAWTLGASTNLQTGGRPVRDIKRLDGSISPPTGSEIAVTIEPILVNYDPGVPTPKSLRRVE